MDYKNFSKDIFDTINKTHDMILCYNEKNILTIAQDLGLSSNDNRGFSCFIWSKKKEAETQYGDVWK